jgi:hypothetical protein
VQVKTKTIIAAEQTFVCTIAHPRISLPSDAAQWQTVARQHGVIQPRDWELVQAV